MDDCPRSGTAGQALISGHRSDASQGAPLGSWVHGGAGHVPGVAPRLPLEQTTLRPHDVRLRGTFEGYVGEAH